MIHLGVPYSQLSQQLNVYNTHEAEAMAMAFGVIISGGEATVHMQDDGALNCLNVITTLTAPYNVNVPIDVFERTDGLPHHEKGSALWKNLANS